MNALHALIAGTILNSTSKLTLLLLLESDAQQQTFVPNERKLTTKNTLYNRLNRDFIKRTRNKKSCIPWA